MHRRKKHSTTVVPIQFLEIPCPEATKLQTRHLPPPHAVVGVRLVRPGETVVGLIPACRRLAHDQGRRIAHLHMQRLELIKRALREDSRSGLGTCGRSLGNVCYFPAAEKLNFQKIDFGCLAWKLELGPACTGFSGNLALIILVDQDDKSVTILVFKQKPDFEVRET